MNACRFLPDVTAKHIARIRGPRLSHKAKTLHICGIHLSSRGQSAVPRRARTFCNHRSHKEIRLVWGLARELRAKTNDCSYPPPSRPSRRWAQSPLAEERAFGVAGP